MRKQLIFPVPQKSVTLKIALAVKKTYVYINFILNLRNHLAVAVLQNDYMKQNLESYFDTNLEIKKCVLF